VILTKVLLPDEGSSEGSAGGGFLAVGKREPKDKYYERREDNARI
jgi:hypothetical protein